MTDILSTHPSLGQGTHCCPLCAGAETELWTHHTGFHIRRCRGCDAGYVPAEEHPADTSALYDREYYSGGREGVYRDFQADEGPMGQTADRLLEWVEEHRPPGTLVEVGAAMGFFVERARRRGWDGKGYEISQFASDVARRRGVDVVQGDFTNPTCPVDTGSADLVVALDTIEHLKDPIRLLTRAAEALKSRGLLLISTGDFGSVSARLWGRQWRLIHPPEHLYYFSRRSLQILSEKSGFDVIAQRFFWKRYTLGSILSHLGVPCPGFLRGLSVPVNLFDVVYVLGRKR